jgi:hypothetical protein
MRASGVGRCFVHYYRQVVRQKKGSPLKAIRHGLRFSPEISSWEQKSSEVF